MSGVCSPDTMPTDEPPNKNCEDLFNSSYPSFILVFHLMSGEQTPDMATCNSFELYKNKKCMVLNLPFYKCL
jgi:hypothetical protein